MKYFMNWPTSLAALFTVCVSAATVNPATTIKPGASRPDDRGEHITAHGGSALTGWKPNANKYAAAKDLKGPWSEFKDIAPPETKTYHSQSTLLLKVVGTNKTTVIFMGDQGKPKAQWDSRSLWIPLEIGAGKLWLPEPREWTPDVKNGAVTVEP